MKKNLRSSKSWRIVAVVSHNFRYVPPNKFLKDNRKQIITTGSQKQVLLLDRCDVIYLGQLKSHRSQLLLLSDLQIATN